MCGWEPMIREAFADMVLSHNREVTPATAVQIRLADQLLRRLLLTPLALGR